MDFGSLVTVIVALITSAASIINTIISKRTNKKVECIDEVKEEIKQDIANMNKKHKEEMDKHILEADKTFLVNFISDVKEGIPKSDIQIKRAYEVYDEYISKNGNSYVHDEWESLRNKGLL